MPLPLKTTSPSPIAHPKATSSSILKYPMRDAATYSIALSQADADARAHRTTLKIDPWEPALSMRSSSNTNSTSFLTTTDDSDDPGDALGVPPDCATSEQNFTTKHFEFGHCSNEAYRHTSSHKSGTTWCHIEDPPYYILITTYLSYLIIIVLGHLRDLLGKYFFPDVYRHLMPQNVRFLPIWSELCKHMLCFSNLIPGIRPPQLRFRLVLFSTYQSSWGRLF